MTPDIEHTSASEARQAAERSLEEATAQGHRVHGIMTSLRELRRRNHFGEGIERAMIRRRST